MHRIDLPAGSQAWLSASARLDAGAHRWDIQVFTTGEPRNAGPPRLTYGSQIGKRDRQQRVNIPVQNADCWLEVTSRHAVAEAWHDSRCTIREDTPALLLLGYSRTAARPDLDDDVLLSFAFFEPGQAA